MMDESIIALIDKTVSLAIVFFAWRMAERRADMLQSVILDDYRYGGHREAKETAQVIKN